MSAYWLTNKSLGEKCYALLWKGKNIVRGVNTDKLHIYYAVCAFLIYKIILDQELHQIELFN